MKPLLPLGGMEAGRRPREESACWVISRVRVAVGEGEQRGSEAGPGAGVEGLPQPGGLGRSWGDFRNSSVND